MTLILLFYTFTNDFNYLYFIHDYYVKGIYNIKRVLMIMPKLSMTYEEDNY